MAAVSVLMSVFNGERYLSVAIESILGQTFGDLEFLVIDDGSTDGTPDILGTYLQLDKRLRVISRGHKGQVASLNELLSRAQGPFIARMDADDVSLPHRLSVQLDFLQNHPEVVCVGGNVELIDEEGLASGMSSLLKSDEGIQRRHLAGYSEIFHPSAMMRREQVARVGGYHIDYSLAEDLDLWLRLGEIGKLANVDDVVLKYRVHSNSLSEQAGPRQLRAARAACEAAWMRRGISGKFDAGSDSELVQSDRHWHHQVMVKYGWRAWSKRRRSTTALYAVRALRARPLGKEGWVLLAYALGKPSKASD